MLLSPLIFVSIILTALSSDLAVSPREAQCEWWHSPILVTGTGGSGTRGGVDILHHANVFMLGEDPNTCKANGANDTSCLNRCGATNNSSTSLRIYGGVSVFF